MCNIFVVETASYALVLGQSIFVQTCFQQTYKGHNVFGTMSDKFQTIFVVF